MEDNRKSRKSNNAEACRAIVSRAESSGRFFPRIEEGKEKGEKRARAENDIAKMQRKSQEELLQCTATRRIVNSQVVAGKFPRTNCSQRHKTRIGSKCPSYEHEIKEDAFWFAIAGFMCTWWSRNRGHTQSA